MDKWDASTHRKLNYCRLYLNVVTLADITKPNGEELDPCLLKGQPSMYSGISTWHTMNQDRPSENEWKLWQKANMLWSDSQARLYQPLGAWLVPLPDLRFQFFAYTYRRSLFVRIEDGQYKVFRHQGHNLFRPATTSPTRSYSQLPPRARPAEVQASFLHSKWKLLGTPSPHLRSSFIPPSATATFDLNVNTLEPWEIDLLRQVTLEVDPYSLCLELTLGFSAVSDGSAKFQTNGSFGWVVSTSDGQRLAYGMGPARGRTIHSYRAPEAYGLLSLLRFLVRIKEYTGMHEPWVGIIATDSKGVIDSLQTGDKDVQAVDDPIDLDAGAIVLDCLRAEWDVLIEIQTAMHALPQVTLKHVKGHHDDKRPYHALNLLEQLNVDADKRAGDYQLEFGTHRPFAIMSPLTRAHLQLSDGTVSGRYKDVLSYESTERPLLEYIRRKNIWSAATLQTVHWEAHAQAIKRTSVPHTHTLVKLLHNILPTQAQANKFDGGTRTCPVCPITGEDFHHILRCTHAPRIELRRTFQRDLRDYLMRNNSSPLLSSLLLAGFRNWFESDSDIQLQPEAFHPSLRTIISQQNKIGWGQIFLGQFSVFWSSHQKGYLLGNTDGAPEDIQRQSLLWQVNLIKFVWEHWYTLWKLRNRDVHGHDANKTRAEAARLEVRRELNDLYRNRNMYEEQVQALLLPSVDDHENQAVKATQNWLTLNAPIFRESYRRVKERALRGMRSIRTYFSAS